MANSGLPGPGQTGYAGEPDKISNRPLTDLGFLQYLVEGVLVLNQGRIIMGVNEALERMLGWSATDLIGRNCMETLICHDPVSETPLCPYLCPLLAFRPHGDKTEAVHYRNMTVACKNGERREVSASFVPLKLPFLPALNPANQAESSLSDPAFETPGYSIIVLRDVTEQTKQVRIKTQFIASASHQLRTPLSSVKTSIGLLLDNIGAEFSPPLLRLLKNIQSSTGRLERLVNDLIELTSLQSGRVQMQPRLLEVRELVNRAVELNRDRLEARQQRVQLDLPAESLYVKADFNRLSQVLGHLLSNASKFSATGQPLGLKVSRSEENQPLHPEVVFQVRDEGIGITPEEQPLIFEKFYQSQVVENVNEVGSGLGLPLAKALVELNGGRLWFESEPGKGSRFYFALPAVSAY